MTAATTARRQPAWTAHRPEELTFAGYDRERFTAAFTAPSASRPGRVNTVTLDLATETATCDCAGAENGRQCWHCHWVAEAFERECCRRAAEKQVARLDDDQLLAAGIAAAARVAEGARLWVAASPLDAAMLTACRREWARRHRARRAESPEPPTPAAPAVALAA